MDRVFHLQRPTQAEREKILHIAAKETMDNELIDFVDWRKWTRETKFWAAGRGHIALLLPNFDVVDNILYMARAIVFAGSMRKSTWIVFLPLCSCFCSLILVRCSVFIQVMDWLFWLRCLWLDIWTEIANHSLLL
ncbi:hypothetical protein ABKV19_004391 [Rosa sericea]